MYRYAIEKLREWKTRKDRLPLILRDAGQVRKTWLVKEFGKSDFKNIITINFEKTPSAIRFFDGEIDPKRIIRLIGIST